MRINITLPGLGGGGKKAPVQEPMPMVKKRYWTPAGSDYEKFEYGKGTGGGGIGGRQQTSAGQAGVGGGPEGSGYRAGDPWYANKAWDKKQQKWVKVSDDIYRTNEDGEQLLWQPAKEPRKKGLMK